MDPMAARRALRMPRRLRARPIRRLHAPEERRGATRRSSARSPPRTAVPGGGSGTAEDARLEEQAAGKGEWRRWGPYVSDRAWGTVREDYSAGGDAWNYFPHDHARSRAYRWSGDVSPEFCDDRQTICLAVALWNEKDAFLKERPFGLSNQKGNHGEDVKEYYFHLDGTPTHSYMKMVYKYPQVAFPYEALVETNRARGQGQPEFELFDAMPDVFTANRYFDVFVEYAKAKPEDILCHITVVNRGPQPRRSACCPISGTATHGRGGWTASGG